MAITKEQKKQLVQQYVQDLQSANTTVVIQQNSLSTNDAVKIRKDLVPSNGRFNVLRKRLFLIAVKEAGLDEVSLNDLQGSIVALYAKGDEVAPLKVVNKYLKKFKSEDTKSSFSFLGGWFEKKRQGADYVNELANVPSKEELISKLAYLFNYPLQSFACVINEIVKKQGAPEPKVEEVKEEVKPEPKIEESKVEEVKAEESKAEEVKVEEPKAEEPKTEEVKVEEVKVEEQKVEEVKIETKIEEVPEIKEEKPKKAKAPKVLKEGEVEKPKKPRVKKETE